LGLYRLNLIVLGGELAVSYTRNPLMRDWIPSLGPYQGCEL